MIKIIALADLHLGRKSTYVPHDVKASTKHTLRKIIDYCLEENIDVILFIGDIIDRENKLFEAYYPIQEAFRRLHENNITCYLVGGNHDYDTLPGILSKNQFPNIHLLGKNGKWESQIYEKDGQRLQIIGWSFPKRYHPTTPFINFDKSIIDASLPSIGILHGDINVSMSSYAPFHKSELDNLGVNFWLLGHIHKSEILSHADPFIAYTGSPQALSPMESGKHGVLRLELDDTSSLAFKEHIHLSEIVYSDIEIDIPVNIKSSDLREHIINQILRERKLLIKEYGNQFFVLDMQFSGFNPDRKLIIDITEELEGNHEIVQGMVIRSINATMLKLIDYDIVKLSQKNNMIGNLANLIKNLDEAESLENPFDEIFLKVEELAKALLNQPAYKGLIKNDSRNILNYQDIDLKKMINIEANTILSHFMMQLQNTENDQ